METREFKANEISCYAEALARVLDKHGTLAHLPAGELHHVGGLLPGTASRLEAVIRELMAAGEKHPSLVRVMAEIDRYIDYQNKTIP